MEVHHHSHTPGKKWTHYLWEFLMLFLAVFCGFLAENQREHFIEKKREKQYVRSLFQDLQADTVMLHFTSRRLERSNKMIDTLIRLLKSNERNEFACKIYNLARTIPFADVPTQPFDKTFDQLKSSGNLRLIHNNEILDDIGTYYKRYEFLSNSGAAQMQFHNRHDLYLFTHELFDMAVFEKMLVMPGGTLVNDFSRLDSCDTKPILLSSDAMVINKICARYYYIHMTRKVIIDWVSNLSGERRNVANQN